MFDQIKAEDSIFGEDGIFLLKRFRSDFAGTQPIRIASAIKALFTIQVFEADDCRCHDSGDKKP